LRRIAFVPLLLVHLALVPTPASAEPEVVEEVETYRQLHLFFEALERIQDHYVEELTTDELIQHAIAGVVAELDPHSKFLDPDAFSAMQSSNQGRLQGIGVVLAIRGETPTVISPIDDTPAKRAGVRAGDRLVMVDGVDTRDSSLDDVVKLLRGDVGSEVEVVFERVGRQGSLSLSLIREEILMESVVGPLAVTPGIGYIRISRFTESTGRDFAAALEALDAGTEGLVLDLRGNPGGLLSQAVEVAERFVPVGDVVVEVRSRNLAECRTYRSSLSAKAELPVAVLIDQGSASAAEIVAGALQDHGLATVVGQSSFGKGSVQSVFGFEMGHALKLTTAHYFTPSGRSVERDPDHADGGAPDTGGIRPDLAVDAAQLDSVLVEVIAEGLVLDYLESGAPGVDLSVEVPAPYIAGFRDYVAERADVPIRACPDPVLARALREEAALRDGGEAAALWVRLPFDPQYQVAIDAVRARAAHVAAADGDAAGR
jgi:carboxyl-terminal processing protease